MTAGAPLGTADEIRRRFDALFAAPPAARGAEVASFVALRIDADRYLLRIQAMRGLAAARTIVPLPGAAAALLGLAGIRGVVVPVFSLSALMGYGAEPPRWLVLCESESGDPIALAFAEFDGYLEAPVTDVSPVDQREARGVFVRELVRGRGESRGVIGLSSVVKAVCESVPAAGPMRER